MQVKMLSFTSSTYLGTPFVDFCSLSVILPSIFKHQPHVVTKLNYNKILFNKSF